MIKIHDKLKSLFFVLSMVLLSVFKPAFSATIAVGRDRPVKDLSKIQDGNEYVLDFGTYDFPSVTVKKSLTIRSAVSDSRATLKFKSSWGALPTGGPDLGSPKSSGSIICYGTCTLKDVKTSGGEGVIIFNSQPNSTLLAQHIDMDGGGILRGSGARSVQLLNVQSTGRPTAYFIANFTNPVSNVLVDFSGNTLPVQQGGHCSNGKPTCDNTKAVGEAAIRFMQADHVVLKSVKTKPWLFDGKHEWKQDLQLRDSNLIEIFNSEFSIVDIGDMAWRKPPKLTNEVRFTDSSVTTQVHLVPGWKKIVYKNTKVAGKVLNRIDLN